MIRKAVAHLNLYDWTFTTWEAMSELGILEQSPARQSVACAWMQSLEPEELELLVETKVASKQLNTFRRTFPLTSLNETIAWFNTQSKQIMDSQVDVVPRPNSGDSGAPGNS